MHHIHIQLLALVLPVLFQPAIYEICVFLASLLTQHGCIYMYLHKFTCAWSCDFAGCIANAVVSAALTGQGLPPCLPTTFVGGELRLIHLLLWRVAVLVQLR